MNSEAFSKQVGGDHYKSLAIQPAEYCQRNRLSYCESAVIRYVTRHQEKNGRQDIEKAIHCLELLLEMEYPVNKGYPPFCESDCACLACQKKESEAGDAHDLRRA